MATADLILSEIYSAISHGSVLFVFILLAAVASTKGCSIPMCEIGQKYCSSSSQDSGQMNITCSSTGKKILKEKDWVAPIRTAVEVRC